jgi:HK97 family phage major capsid protein
MSNENAQVVLERADLEAAMVKATENLESVAEKAMGEARDANSVSVETKSAVEKLTEKAAEIGDRLIALEQRESEIDAPVLKSLGEQFIESESFQAMAEGRQSRAKLELKTAIVNTYPESSVQPLVQGDRMMQVYTTPNRRLTLRDIMPVMPTDSNLIEFTRENAFTNNAGPQRDTASPLAAVENQTLPESANTFTLATTPVVTLGHWIPVSQQVMGDSPMLAAHVNSRLMYGLKLKEETQLLKGLGTGRELNGIQTQATAYTPESPQLTNEIDIIRDAITQAQVAEYSPNFIVLNPADWDSIQRRKVGSSDDRYVYGDPNMSWNATPLWGLTPIVTNSQTAGTFLIGDVNGAAIFDRQQASVEASFEDSTNFQKLMVSLRATERLALAVFRTEAFITGSL